MDLTGKQSALVTGASGFIGRHLVRRLTAAGWRVSCLVRSTSHVDELRGVGAGLITGDINDRVGMVRAIAASEARVVFHLAGLVRSASSEAFLRANKSGAETVAAACADQGTPPVLVLVSSLAAAGPSGTAPRLESDPPSPVSAYGRSKLSGELAVARYSGAVPITIVRPPIVFGPGDRAMLEVFRLIAQWGVHAVPGRRGGNRRVSLVHVDDLVDGLLLAAVMGERIRADGGPGQGVYFMAAEECPTYSELGLAIAAALERSSPTILRVPGPVLRLLGVVGDLLAVARGRTGWMNSDKVREALAVGSWDCSSAKAREQLGWKAAPTGTLAGRLHETAAWYRQAGWL